jgi:nicotinamide-nucleotide amidase
MTDDLYELSRRVGRTLRAFDHKLVTAESCTGGWVAQCITDVAGSSAWFDRGFVTYSNEAKRSMLGVTAGMLKHYGAVSAEVVRAMAAGALENSAAHCALAVSGIAGPTGGSQVKPVGTVWFAWQRADEECVVKMTRFAGDRRSVRRQAVRAALQGIIDLYGPNETSMPGTKSGLPGL